jgi:hypothetical protein
MDRISALRRAIAGVVITLVMTLPRLSVSQIVAFNPRDDQFRLLGLTRVWSEMQRAANERARARQMLTVHGMSAQEYEGIASAYERARVDYLQQALAVYAGASRVVVQSAKKFRNGEGRPRVRLEVVLSQSTTLEQAALQGMLDSASSALSGLEQHEAFISLKASTGQDGAIIARPYEQRVVLQEPGVSKTVDFELLKDVEDLAIAITFTGRLDERRVLLESSSDGQKIGLRPSQFSVGADLGARAEFVIHVERFGEDTGAFELRAVGLPVDVQWEFRDSASQALLNQVRFGAGEARRTVQLSVHMPSRLPNGWVAGSPVSFAVAAIGTSRRARFAGLPISGQLADIRANSDGTAALEIVPLASTRAELRIEALYQEITGADSFFVDATIRNTGMAPITNAGVAVQVPSGWSADAQPRMVRSIRPGEEKAVRVVVHPVSDLSVGDYEIKAMLLTDQSEGSVEGSERVIRVHFARRGGLWVATILALGLVGAVVFGMVWSVRRARR